MMLVVIIVLVLIFLLMLLVMLMLRATWQTLRKTGSMAEPYFLNI